MTLFNVYEHPNTKGLDAVKQGYCFPVLFLNVLPFGWIWGFVRKAPRVARPLLAVSVKSMRFGRSHFVRRCMDFVDGIFGGAWWYC
jgi:hypothetical protein